MKIIDRLRTVLESFGGCLIEDNTNFTLGCHAPRGYHWTGTNKSIVVIRATMLNNHGYVKAIWEDAYPLMRMGLHKVVDPQMLLTEMLSNGAHWKAHADAPARIEWPKAFAPRQKFTKAIEFTAVPVHFQANYVPQLRQFRVEISVGNPTIINGKEKFAAAERWVEMMTPKRYLAMVEGGQPIFVSGVEVKFDGDFGKEAEQNVRMYLRQVAESYRGYAKLLGGS